MAISNGQEVALAAATAAKNRQDTKTPFLININDARLMPNIPLLRQHKDYRVFTGSPNASLEERQQYLSSGRGQGRAVVLPPNIEEIEPFDIGKADAEELVNFAFTEYGLVLTATTPLRQLRKQVADAANGMSIPKFGDGLS